MPVFKLQLHLGHFTRTGNTILLSDVADIENVARLARAGSATKLLGQCYRIFIEIFATCCRYWGHQAWLHIEPPVPSVKLLV